MAAYALMGFLPVERDSNAGMTMKQQMATRSRVPKLTPVYQTDSLKIAKGILKDGGFTGTNGEWIVVQEIKMNLTAGDGTIAKSSNLGGN